ncbi:DoxX family protein [Streptomyces sp. H39-S7]|uniref:DoxX family protein n=1 Tax=Streptomyces sp. H39-S7 TaxID=3004357 RepID=UPI0022AE855D|nr:DoxX family protein [Streptomyces sp. H39-S7]MCZ4126150.1 DoxX family protein [Streptomyces sp. H39-S7]
MTARLDRAQPYALSLFRIVVGLLFTCHGVASLFGVLGRPEVSAGAWPGWYAALIQLVGGVLVLLGLATRPAALIGSGSMAFAYFDVHQKHALLPIQNGGEAAVFFCWALLLIVFAGPGALALDRMLSRRAVPWRRAAKVPDENQTVIPA